jgi:hypothetical protein
MAAVGAALLVPASAFAAPAKRPTTFQPFTGSGAGYAYAFSKPVRSSRNGMLQFQFPGTLRIASVHAPLYTLVSVYLLYVAPSSPPPSVSEQASDISQYCLGRFFISHPVPSGVRGFAYECRPNLSGWTCTSDVQRANVRVAISVTAPNKDQCGPYETLLRNVFFHKAVLALR